MSLEDFSSATEQAGAASGKVHCGAAFTLIASELGPIHAR